MDKVPGYFWLIAGVFLSASIFQLRYRRAVRIINSRFDKTVQTLENSYQKELQEHRNRLDDLNEVWKTRYNNTRRRLGLPIELQE